MRASSLALAVALVSQAGCGVAQRAARSAAEGAVGTVARKVGGREDIKEVAEGTARRAAGAMVSELGQPEQLAHIRRITGAVAGGAVTGAWRAASRPLEALVRPDERGGRGTTEVTPIEAIAEQAARAFSRQLIADLGSSGEGPLTTSLSAMTERVTESVVRGARGDLAPLFPECHGAGASTCVDRAVERLSRASSAGVAAGILASLGVWPLVLAFGGGVVAALVVAWAWGVYRARRVGPAS